MFSYGPSGEHRFYHASADAARRRARAVARSSAPDRQIAMAQLLVLLALAALVAIAGVRLV